MDSEDVEQENKDEEDSHSYKRKEERKINGDKTWIAMTKNKEEKELERDSQIRMKKERKENKPK